MNVITMKNLALLLTGITYICLIGYFLPVLIKTVLLVSLVIFLWATSALPTWLTSFIFFLGGIMGHLASNEILLSGMTSNVVWLVLSGVILGGAIRHTELDKVFAQFILPYCEKSYKQAILAVMLLGLLVVYLMPSTMGRIILLVPILVATAETLGYKRGQREFDGIVVAGILATFLPGFYVLPSNVPNNVLAGSMQTIYQISYTYTEYWIDFFPVLGVGKMLLIYGAILFLYRGSRAPLQCKKEAVCMTRRQKFLMVLLIVTIILWITEFLHHIPIGWVGMLSAIICFIPGLHFMPSEKPLRSIGFEPFFFVGGIISMSALVKHSGIADILANQFLVLVNMWHPSEFILITMWLVACAIVCFISTVSGAPAIMTPIMGAVSSMSGVSLGILAKLQMVSYSNFLFFYQAPPMLVALTLEELPKKELFMIILFVSFMGYVLLGPISYLYWQML